MSLFFNNIIHILLYRKDMDMSKKHKKKCKCHKQDKIETLALVVLVIEIITKILDYILKYI